MAGHQQLLIVRVLVFELGTAIVQSKFLNPGFYSANIIQSQAYPFSRSWFVSNTHQIWFIDTVLYGQNHSWVHQCTWINEFRKKRKLTTPVKKNTHPTSCRAYVCIMRRISSHFAIATTSGHNTSRADRMKAKLSVILFLSTLCPALCCWLSL